MYAFVLDQLDMCRWLYVMAVHLGAEGELGD